MCIRDRLKSFAHKIQAPVADSLMGKGAFDGTDELYTGMVGMHLSLIHILYGRRSESGSREGAGIPGGGKPASALYRHTGGVSIPALCL